MPSRSDPTDELRAHLRGQRQASGPHPSPEQMVAYHEKRLPPGEAEEIRAHLAACPDCAIQILELAALLEEPDEDPGPEVSRAELDAAWERQRARRSPAPPAAPPQKGRPGAPLRRAWAAAASLGLAASVLAMVALVQWRTITQLRQPQANPPLVNLEPDGSVRQGSRPPSELRLFPEASRAWVILNPAAEPDLPAYEIEVLGPDGETVHRFPAVRSSETGTFRLEIPRAVLAREGDYRIVLTGSRAGQREAAGEFQLRVRLTPSP